MELYKKFRPKSLDQVIGQPTAVKTLKNMLKTDKVPQSLLLSGPSGVGKTTIARILRTELDCSDWNFNEINCAGVESATDTIRSISKEMHLSPMGGSCRVYYLDEIQSFSKAGFAQQAMLKILEDTPRGVYFFLAATDTDKLLPAIRTRCTEIKLKSLSETDLKELVYSVAGKESKGFSGEVIKRIVQTSYGSARKALVLLNQVIGLDSEKEQLSALSASDNKGKAFDLVKELVYSSKPSWKSAAKIIQDLKIAKDEVEGFRHFVLACANTELLKAGPNSHRAFLVLDVFGNNWFDCLESGLTRAAFEVIDEISK